MLAAPAACSSKLLALARNTFDNYNKNGNLVTSGIASAVSLMMRMGGRLRGPLYAPFQWDGQWMLDRKVVPAGRTIRVGDSTAQYLVPENYMAEDIEQAFTKANARIFCRSGENSLQVVFILSPRVPAEDFAKHRLRVTLGSEKQGLFSMPGRCKNGFRATCYKLVKTNLENAGQGDAYEAVTGNKAVITIPAPGVQTAEGEVAIEFNIPYESMPRLPQPARTWLFNASYTSDNLHGSSTWEHNFNRNMAERPRQPADSDLKRLYSGKAALPAWGRRQSGHEKCRCFSQVRFQELQCDISTIQSLMPMRIRISGAISALMARITGRNTSPLDENWALIISAEPTISQ